MVVACYNCKFGWQNTGVQCAKIECGADHLLFDPIETNQHYDAHYNKATVQPIEIMQANMTPEEFAGFLKGNIIKYVCRCGKKDEPAKEATKIKRYSEWLEMALKGEKINPRK